MNNIQTLNQITDFSSNIVRNNPLFYLEQRQGLPELKPSSAPNIFPPKWYENYHNDHVNDDDNNNNNTDDNDDQYEPISTKTCSLYMAQSSIPNSGLGIFAGRDFTKDEMVDPSPQAVIPLFDMESNPLYSSSILADYPWSAWSQNAQFESTSVNVLYPNLGMLANSHLGLANVNQNVKNGKWINDGSLDRRKDYSTGANTLYHAATFKVSDDETIRRGEEIFVDYGKNYFHHREEKFHMVFPTFENYEEADKIVREFAKKLENVGDGISPEYEQEWKDIIVNLENDSSKIRVAYALPDLVHDVKYVAEVGTARYSIPDSIRSVEWLEENGFCLDNLRVGKSMIPYAGNGMYYVLCYVCVLRWFNRNMYFHSDNATLYGTHPYLSASERLLSRSICHEKNERGIRRGSHASITNT